jgi:hypothetical protein
MLLGTESPPRIQFKDFEKQQFKVQFLFWKIASHFYFARAVLGFW